MASSFHSGTQLQGALFEQAHDDEPRDIRAVALFGLYLPTARVQRSYAREDATRNKFDFEDMARWVRKRTGLSLSLVQDLTFPERMYLAMWCYNKNSGKMGPATVQPDVLTKVNRFRDMIQCKHHPEARLYILDKAYVYAADDPLDVVPGEDTHHGQLTHSNQDQTYILREATRGDGLEVSVNVGCVVVGLSFLRDIRTYVKITSDFDDIMSGDETEYSDHGDKQRDLKTGEETERSDHADKRQNSKLSPGFPSWHPCAAPEDYDSENEQTDADSSGADSEVSHESGHL